MASGLPTSFPRVFRSLLFLLLFCHHASCNLALATQDATTSSASQPVLKPWTIMVFMAADNNLEAGADQDLNEMETVGSNDTMNIVVQLDRNGRYSEKSELKWTGARRFLIRRDDLPKKFTSPHLLDLGPVDMAAPESLLAFVRWAKEAYPAERYALILWNHGTGWKEADLSMNLISGTPEQERTTVERPSFQPMPGSISCDISYDETSGNWMDIPTLEKSLIGIRAILGKPIELLGYDACLMQMVEVAHAAASTARFQVASPDWEPENGWPYDSILTALNAAPDMDGCRLGKTIVEKYRESYINGSQGNTAVTLSLIDLSRLRPFEKELLAFSKAVQASIRDIDDIEQARDETLKYFYSDYADLGHFLSILSRRTAPGPLQQAADRLRAALVGEAGVPGLVIANGVTGDKYRDSTGACIFFPDRAGFFVYKNRYHLLSFAARTGWFSLLEELRAPSLPYLKLQDIVLEDQNHDGRFAAGETVKVFALIRNLGRQKADNAILTAVTDSPYLSEKTVTATIDRPLAPGQDTTVQAMTLTIRSDAPIDGEVKLAFTLISEKAPPSTFTSAFFIKSPFQSAGHVLLVYTDAFSPAAPILQATFQDAGIPFDPWDRMLDGEIKEDVLKRYCDGWVYLAVQDSSTQQQLSPTEITVLEEYLEHGGRLLMSGQDLAYSLRETPFLKKLARIDFVQDDTNIHVLSGVGGPFKNQTYQIFGGDGANNQKWPDEIDPLAGSDVLMRFDAAARDMVNDSDMNGPDLKPGSRTRGIKSSGAAAVQVIDGYRLLFFAFGLEAVNSQSQRQLMLKEINDLLNSGLETQIRDLGLASARHVPTSLTLSEYADLPGHIEQRLTARIGWEMEKDPSAGDRALETIRTLPADQRELLANLEKSIRDLRKFRNQHEYLPQR